MFDRYRFKLSFRIVLIVLGIFISFIFIKVTYSLFHSDSNGVIGSKIAFYVIDPKKQTESIKIGEITPDGQDYTYNIEVSNFKDDKVSEVNLDYTFEVITTTNIPVTYSLYKDDGNENIIGNREIIQDSNGMHFFKYESLAGSFTHDVSRTDKYTLVVNFPQMYNNEMYQDLIDTIEISVDAKQV